jgi:hypothetical protein
MDVTEEHVRKVWKALENPKYRWRTIPGVAKEEGLPEEVVEEVLKRRRNEIVKSTLPSSSGEDLYTTRSHFIKEASFGEKLLGAFKNRLGSST